MYGEPLMELVKLPIRAFAIAIVLYSIPVLVMSDNLVIPDISTQPAQGPDAVQRPTRSMTMDQVRDQFGPPIQVVGPVGNPPITRWVYDKFGVHFEGQYVIHSSVRRRSN